MHGLLDAGDGAAEIDRTGGVVQVVDGRVRGIVGAGAFSASCALFGVQRSVMVMVARITPSWSRKAMSCPGSMLSAKSWETSSVIGMGQSVPSARRMVSTTEL